MWSLFLYNRNSLFGDLQRGHVRCGRDRS
jgi:hypothetical protein